MLASVAASLLGSMLTGKGVMRAAKGAVKAGTWYHNMDQISKIF